MARSRFFLSSGVVAGDDFWLGLGSPSSVEACPFQTFGRLVWTLRFFFFRRSLRRFRLARVEGDGGVGSGVGSCGTGDGGSGGGIRARVEVRATRRFFRCRAAGQGLFRLGGGGVTDRRLRSVFTSVPSSRATTYEGGS